jgi:hypothetical protein
LVQVAMCLKPCSGWWTRRMTATNSDYPKCYEFNSCLGNKYAG